MDKLGTSLVIVMAALICVAFFMPWVSVESQVIGGISKVLTGKQQASIDAISGYEVPIMANSEDSRLMISIIQIFNPNVKDADKKSWLIWGVPVLAVLLAIGYFLFGQNKFVGLVVGLIGVAIFAVVTYKIKTTDLNKLVLNVKIGNGLWLTLFGYLGMGIIALLGTLMSKVRKVV